MKTNTARHETGHNVRPTFICAMLKKIKRFFCRHKTLEYLYINSKYPITLCRCKRCKKSILQESEDY